MKNTEKKIVTGIVIIAVSFVSIRSNLFRQALALFSQLLVLVDEEVEQNRYDETQQALDAFEGEYVASLWKKDVLLDINGIMANKLGVRTFYSDLGINITDNGYITGPYAWTTTDYEVEQIASLKQYLDELGVNLLYVNEPIKYIDDDYTLDQFGKESFSNRNMDLFLARIGDYGINYLDLRELITNEGLDVLSLFYKTDHHWTVPAGLWATKHIAEAMNKYCGYDIDIDMYNPRNYQYIEYKNCWLGEQGRKIAKSYVGLDDFTEVKPGFDTSYSFKKSGELVDGDFNGFIKESIYNSDKDVYESKSWHYSYTAKNCINKNIEKGKVLVLGDSYGMVMEPFLSLEVHEIDFLIMRSKDDSFSLRDYIKRNGYDTVIIAYAQFMLGAHDTENNANYRMFSFDK